MKVDQSCKMSCAREFTMAEACGRPNLFFLNSCCLYIPEVERIPNKSCTGQPHCFGCVGLYALCLGRIAHARSVVFCQPITALTCTSQQRCPKVTPWEQFPGLFRPSCMAWLTTEVLKRRAIVFYATLELFLIAKPSISLQLQRQL